MPSHEVDYEIIGDDIQIVEVELDPGETVIAEAGAMNYMDDGITFETKMGDGSKPDNGLMGKLMSAGKRALTGESIFMTHFTNSGSGKKRVSFAAPYPGKIVPIKLSKVGGEMLCQKDAFLCAAMGTEVSIAFQQKTWCWIFRRRRLYFAATARRWNGIYSCRRNHCQKDTQKQSSPSGHRLFGGIYPGNQI